MNLLSRLATCRLAVAVLGCCLTFAVPARATTVVPPEFPALVNGSDCIVRAVVKKVSSLKKQRPQGERIFTEVELAVTEVVAGTAPATLTLTFLGGRVGREELTVQGSPQFKAGDEDILFVSGNGTTLCPLYAMGHGRYPVLREATTGRAYVARANGVPLHDAAEISLPLTEGAAAAMQRGASSLSSALAPEDFIRQIRGAVNPSTKPRSEK